MEWDTEYMPNTLNISICSVKKKNLQSLDSLGETVSHFFTIYNKNEGRFIEKVIEKSPNQRYFF